MNCRQVDELGAAYAIGAVEALESQAIDEHLETCPEPHDELRSVLGIGAVLAASTEPIPTSSALRDRLMATASATPQEHLAASGGASAAPVMSPAPSAERRRWLRGWSSPSLLRGLAFGGVAATLILAVAAGALWGQLRDREELLRSTAAAIANGDVAYRVQGEAGSGYLVDTEGSGATLIVAGVRQLSAEMVYELWLIDADGVPVAAGAFRPTAEEIAIVTVGRDLAGFTTFAVTVEEQPVDQPTSAPVMVATLEG
jgi:anti-sigma-K factor RskA